MSNLLIHGRAATQLSPYRCLGLVGQGQFGRVYCAIDRRTGQFVALKLLDCLDTHQFLRELRFLLSLRHPNIVGVSAISALHNFKGNEHRRNGRCLVMQYCEGGTLRNLMETHRFGETSRLPIALCITLVLDVLAGLEAAHAQGIVHCDIKPENILLSLTPTGWTAQISDFGIARSLQEQLNKPACTGSPAYMAPERFYGQYSQSVDLYAVGILLYELVVGCRPFSGAPIELMSAHLNESVKIPDRVPAPLQAIILTALEKLKARRFQSAAQMRSALQIAAQQCEAVPLERADATGSIQILREEALSNPVQHIALVELSPLSQFDRYLRRSTIVFLANPHHIQSRSFDSLKGISQARSVSEPIQALTVRPQGCFVQTDRSLYLASEDRVQLLRRFYQPSQIAIDSEGRWMAVATLNTNQQLQLLSVWKLPQLVLARRPIRVESTIESLSQLFIVDSTYIAAFLRTQNRNTRVRLFNRRGQSIGAFNLAIELRQVIQTPHSFCFAATETGLAQSLLIIEFKPYKLTRILLEIVPKFLVALPEGLAVSDGNGQLILLNYDGEVIDRFIVPKSITAITACGDRSLLIATWYQNQGKLYRLNLIFSSPPNLVS